MCFSCQYVRNSRHLLITCPVLSIIIYKTLKLPILRNNIRNEITLWQNLYFVYKKWKLLSIDIYYINIYIYRPLILDQHETQPAADLTVVFFFCFFFLLLLFPLLHFWSGTCDVAERKMFGPRLVWACETLLHGIGSTGKQICCLSFSRLSRSPLSPRLEQSAGAWFGKGWHWAVHLSASIMLDCLVLD